jgi:hypothetical protein
MTIQPISGSGGKTEKITTPGIGSPGTRTIKLKKGVKYKATINHTGTKDAPGKPWFCWEAQIDKQPREATFPSYQATRNPGVAEFFAIGGGNWIVDNRPGLFTSHTHQKTPEAGNVAGPLEAILLPVEIRWNIPLENWENVGGHEESQNGEPSVIISIPEPWNDPDRIDELGLKLRCFSDRHLPGGTPENVNLMDHTETVYKTVGGELLVSFDYEVLNQFGIIPNDETDSFPEYSYCDTATPESEGSNLSDSHAFAAGISNGAPNENGKAEGEGSLDNLIGKANREFMRHAGVDFLHFSFGGAETEKRQVRNQVEWFYYSGHGSHNTGELLLLDGNFSASDTFWHKELEAVILAGCSVLDIKNYRAQSFGILTYAKWLAAGGASSPGAQWEATGPKYLLGYAWAAPLDTQGADSIAADFTAGLNAGKHVITAWRDANDRGIARNACLIDTASSPPVYYYWDEQGENPVWTSITKGAGGW